MVCVGYGGFIPFVGFGETSTDYTMLIIAMAILFTGTISAMKIDSIPWRITIMIINFLLPVVFQDYDMMYSIFAILAGIAVLFRTVYDAIARGAEV